MGDLFLEVIVAPRFQPDAIEILAKKKNLRLVEVPRADGHTLDYKRVRSGFLVQEVLHFNADESAWTVPTKRRPTDEEMADLRFAWTAVMSVKSNAILLARDRAAIGIGAGQMSRVDSSMLAVQKAKAAGHEPAGSALASDAFFPFRDGVDAAAAAGVRAIIQPGGSVRDAEVIAAADEHGIAMVLTGVRQFRH
jgi:phosphoribosylaminoimidazolecarboxamide formyltransferase/IMP cyclohydrolase